MTAAPAHIADTSFELLYMSLREKERRIYTDDELLRLPDIEKEHPHYVEWQLRKESYERLKKYLTKKISPMKILEVGCGNGWLSRRLSSLPGSAITGIDINHVELQQAKRVFGNIPNLRFLNTAIDSNELSEFDHIIFAASLHYFSSPEEIIGMAMKKLKAQGEIHILDTAFYQPNEVAAAKERTAAYFNTLGFPEMTAFYFHHTIAELRSFRYEIRYEPSFFRRQIYNDKNPFPWISIKRS